MAIGSLLGGRRAVVTVRIGSNTCLARGTRFAVAKLLPERDLNLKLGGYPGNLGQ